MSDTARQYGPKSCPRSTSTPYGWPFPQATSETKLPLAKQTLPAIILPFLFQAFAGLDQEMATKWHYDWFPGPILGASCTMFLSLTRWSGSRGQAWPENDRKRQKLKLPFLFLALIAIEASPPPHVRCWERQPSNPAGRWRAPEWSEIRQNLRRIM